MRTIVLIVQKYFNGSFFSKMYTFGHLIIQFPYPQPVQ